MNIKLYIAYYHDFRFNRHHVTLNLQIEEQKVINLIPRINYPIFILQINKKG